MDRILDFRGGDQPELDACKYISANEAVFEGHFNRLHLWPGIYTQEGLGQSCFLLYWIFVARRRWEETGGEPDEVLGALRNLDLGYRLEPGYDPELARFFRTQMPADTVAMGVSSSVELKFLKPIFAGNRLDYTVRLTHELQNQIRFEVLAEVEEDPAARGVMTARVIVDLPKAIRDR